MSSGNKKPLGSPKSGAATHRAIEVETPRATGTKPRGAPGDTPRERPEGDTTVNATIGGEPKTPDPRQDERKDTPQISGVDKILQAMKRIVLNERGSPKLEEAAKSLVYSEIKSLESNDLEELQESLTKMKEKSYREAKDYIARVSERGDKELANKINIKLGELLLALIGQQAAAQVKVTKTEAKYIQSENMRRRYRQERDEIKKKGRKSGIRTHPL